MKLKMPKFRSEEEEANWWYDNREEHSKVMAEAIAKGETTTLADILERRRKKTGRYTDRIDPNRSHRYRARPEDRDEERPALPNSSEDTDPGGSEPRRKTASLIAEKQSSPSRLTPFSDTFF